MHNLLLKLTNVRRDYREVIFITRKHLPINYNRACVGLCICTIAHYLVPGRKNKPRGRTLLEISTCLRRNFNIPKTIYLSPTSKFNTLKLKFQISRNEISTSLQLSYVQLSISLSRNFNFLISKFRLFVTCSRQLQVVWNYAYSNFHL